MSSPGATQAVSRPDLRNTVVQEWDLNGENEMFIADKIAKRVDVENAAGTVRRIPREAFTKRPNSVFRGPDGRYAETTYGDETFTYATQERGLKQKVDHNLRAQTKLYYDAEVVAARMILGQLRREHEIEVQGKVQSTSTFTGASLTTAISTSWKTANAATAIPISDINGARAKVRLNCGREANTLIIPWQSFEYAIETSQVLGRINGGATNGMPARAKIAAFAELVNIPNVIIAGGIKDSALQGQTFTGADVWNSDRVMVAYINPSASLTDINLVNVYNWEADGGSYDWTTETYYDEDLRGDYVRARRQVGVSVEYPECGHLLTNASA